MKSKNIFVSPFGYPNQVDTQQAIYLEAELEVVLRIFVKDRIVLPKTFSLFNCDQILNFLCEASANR